MTTHNRLPALAMLIFALGVGIAAMAAAGQFHHAATASIPELESRIAAGHADAATWTDYANALRANKNFSSAADAYAKAIELNPENKDLRFNQALSLGQANQTEKFFAAINHLSATDPKIAVNVLERSELSDLHTDPRFAPALKTARSQAAD